MGLKSNYTQLRNKGMMTQQFLFKYYLEKGGKIKDFGQFQSMFSIYPSFSVEEFCKKLDKEFGLNTLWDSEGKFVKIVK